MELKKFFFIIIFIFSPSFLFADLIKPDSKLNPLDVVKIQLNALKNNNDKDFGIKQTWLFAHPANKKMTGPYERFKSMIYGQQYKFLLNHNSHKINLVMNTSKKHIYEIEILSKNKEVVVYEWHIQRGSEQKCKNCWYTSVVTPPVDQENTI
jgi:hypothetical protein